MKQQMKECRNSDMECNEIIIIGNYTPSNYDASRVVNIKGVAPCVKENHGTVTAILVYENE